MRDQCRLSETIRRVRHGTRPACVRCWSLGLEIAEAGVADGRHFLEIEVTPNRPDWLSHYGIAREIAAKVPGARLSRSGLAAHPAGQKNGGLCGRHRGCGRLPALQRLHRPRGEGACIQTPAADSYFPLRSAADQQPRRFIQPGDADLRSTAAHFRSPAADGK